MPKAYCSKCYGLSSWSEQKIKTVVTKLLQIKLVTDLLHKLELWRY